MCRKTNKENKNDFHVKGTNRTAAGRYSPQIQDTWYRCRHDDKEKQTIEHGQVVVACLLRRGSRHAELPQAVKQVHPAYEARSQGVPSREDVEGAGAQRLAREQIHGGRHFGAPSLLAENSESPRGGEEKGSEILGVGLVSFYSSTRRSAKYYNREERRTQKRLRTNKLRVVGGGSGTM